MKATAADLSPIAPYDRRMIVFGFVGIHLVALVGLFLVRLSTRALLFALAMYLIRMFAITAGYHRYFAHRSYKTSRVFQFVLAFLGAGSGQNGALWWAGSHRQHHKYSDTEDDPHSPLHGIWTSHVGWVFDPANLAIPPGSMKDFESYPELRYLEHSSIPVLAPVVVAFAWLRWEGVVALALSTVALYHCTFLVNSVCHLYGTRRYETDDRSRNNWWVAIFTLGEGWHNNHHHCQSSARQGLRWWEYDVTFYVLTMLSWLGIVWDLRRPASVSRTAERSTSGI